MYLPDEYKVFLEHKGISLPWDGLKEKALKRDDALSAIKLLRSAGVPVAGGDVYVRRGDCVELAYNNWSIQRGDTPEDSWVLAENYINNYPVLSDGEAIFVLVPSATKRLE